MSQVLGFLTLAGAVSLLVLAIALEIRITIRARQFRWVRVTTVQESQEGR